MSLSFQLPGTRSYRGRYLYFIVIAIIAILMFAFSSWKEITLASHQARHNIETRVKSEHNLNQIINQFQGIKVYIYQYSLEPEFVDQSDIYQSLTGLMELTSEIDINVYDDVDAESLNNFIFQIPLNIQEQTVELIKLRMNSRLWIPMTQIMLEKMQPLNAGIITLLNGMLADLQGEPVPNAELQLELLKLKNDWSNTISEFRLFAANRFGIFNNANQSLDHHVTNMRVFLEKLISQMQSIKALDLNNSFTLIQDVQLPQLDEKIKLWDRYSLEAITALKQPDWRRDIAALRKIEVLLNEFEQTAIMLRNELAKQSIRDIENLNQVNQSLSFFIVMLSLLGLFLGIIGFLFLDRNLLHPIARTTRALLLQSKGLSQELAIDARTSETRDLVEAFNQMSEQIKQRENRLDHIAHHDALTQLPNRLLFNERLEHAIQLTRRSSRLVALMILDLDRFKTINDSLGHLFGDKLLQKAAHRLKQHIRAGDSIARLGGDEFAIILENIHEINEIESFARKINSLFEKPFRIEDQEIYTSTSVGIAIAPNDSIDPMTLTRYADIAMYESKKTGRNQYTLFDEELINADESIIKFENQLREAITGFQFELHFQPLIDTQSDAFVACEALLRWRHPQRGMLYPRDFISILDNSSLLFDLTNWVIKECQHFQTQLSEAHQISPIISINFPSIIFEQKHFRERIESTLLSTINDPKKFILEVTEDTLITDMTNTSAMLEKLHNRGFRIALDDFGTGQSSLSHLRAFPIDMIKIDEEFVRNVHTDENDANLVSAIISMGQDMGLQVIAEGVEKQQQLDFLVQRNCHLIQGHLLSKPLPAEDYIRFLQQRSKRPDSE